MMSLLIFEVVFFPLYLWYLKILDKRGLFPLTENRFGLFVVSYLCLIPLTVYQLFPVRSAGSIICLVLAPICWFPGYPIARRIYRQINSDK